MIFMLYLMKLLPNRSWRVLRVLSIIIQFNEYIVYNTAQVSFKSGVFAISCQ